MGFSLASICHHAYLRQQLFVVFVFRFRDHAVPFFYETFHLNAVDDCVPIRIDGPQQRE